MKLVKRGVLELQKGTNFTGLSTVVCRNRITFGERDLISWKDVYKRQEDVRMRVHRCGFSKVRSLLIRVISSSLSFKEKVRYIKRIISDDPTQNMLKRINCREYRLPIRVFALLVKHKNYLLV